MLLALWCTTALAAPSWDEAVPLLEKYCFDCHDADVTKGEVDLAKFLTEQDAMTEVRMWEKAAKLIHDYEMPPSEKKKQPTEDDRKILQGWISGALDRMALANAGDPGTVTMRRLNNAEFDNTIRDLTGLTLNLSQKFPKDGGGGEGFANTGDVLFTSPEQLEKYLAAARTVTERMSALPGRGIHFHENPVGLRMGTTLSAAVEKDAADWYRAKVTPLMPDKPAELREADYLLACWKHRHGQGALPDLAHAAGLNPHFLQNWWIFLNHNNFPSRFLDLIRIPWKNLPGPDRAEEAQMQINAIAAQQQSWLKGWEHGYSVQRKQQDIDSLNPEWIEIPRGENGMVYLCATDLGDGNAGDIVEWRNPTLTLKDGSSVNLFATIEEQLKWHQGELRASRGNPEEVKKKIEWLNSLLALRGQHPNGKGIAPQSFAVRAPSSIGFWIPEHTTLLKVEAVIEQEDPHREATSLQVFGRSNNAPEPLPAIMPGEPTQWHRGTEAYRKVREEFEAIHRIFPADRDKRVDRVADNAWGHNEPGVYYFSDEQLATLLPQHEKMIPEQIKLDYRISWKEQPNPDVAQLWDTALVSHLWNFAERAWRRPLSEPQRENIRQLYHQSFSEIGNREEACREVVVRTLVSPHFLYKTEPPKGEQTETPLDGWEIASRLSYFLWSSTPDERLLASARDGRISKPEEIDALIQHMLTDRKSTALAQDFAGQWFGFADFLSHGTVDGEKFKTAWGDGLRWSMSREVTLFFENLIQKDRPVTDILQANYTFLDSRLAQHYRVPGVDGNAGNFREWDVSAQNRGGLLGMGAILTKTSYPRRTSPVLRGDWVLRTVLGQETPPPPADVPEIGDEEVSEDLTLRQRLEKHRQASECATCHAKIDPPGFALENFDAIGRWRDTDEAGHPISSKATLKNGTEFEGITGLKQHLRDQEAAFLRQFCRKFLGYALGREVGIGDRPLLEEMEAALKRENYRFSAAVRTIVHSRQFKNRKND